MKSISMVATIVVPLIIYPYVTRILQADGIGKVSFSQSVIFYFTMIAQLGIPTYGIREVAKCRDDKIKLLKLTKELFIINLITCAISYILFFICLNTIPQMKSDRTLFIVMSLTTVLQVIGIEWLYSGLEMYNRLMASSIIVKILMVVGTFIFVKSKNDYVWYGAMLVLGTAGYGLINFFLAGSVIDLKMPMSEEINLTRHLKPILVFFAMSVAVTIYTQMDSVMLGFISGTTENGYYDAAVKIKLVLVSFITSLGTVIMPRASYYLQNNDQKAFDEVAKNAMKIVIAFSIPFCVYCIVMAEPIILILSGEGFVNSIVPMKLILPTIVLIGISYIIGIQIMVPFGKEKGVLVAEISGAVINLIVNALLIPSMGASGAAIGTVIAELAVLVAECLFMKEYLHKVFALKDFLRVLMILVVSTVSLFLSLQIIKELSYPLQLVLSGIVFFGIYAIFVAPKLIRSLHNI